MKQKICDWCGKDKTGWCVNRASISLKGVHIYLSFAQDICTDCLPGVIKQLGNKLCGKEITIEDEHSGTLTNGGPDAVKVCVDDR